MVVCGSTSGPKVELMLPRLFFKQFEIIGSSMGSYQEFDELLALVDSGLPITIDQEYPLQGYEDALARLEHGEQLGKIVLNHEGG
jgi:D-arabinose 1-dehydrogenase-like Zn-dependent alcohol dehydrogenase